MDTEVVISNVPPYIWHRGCGPTAAGMILGYWDGHGFDDIVSGSATSQTSAVDAMISSTGNRDDYYYPYDTYPTLLPDASETNAVGCHTNNCLADWMNTSRSVYSNYAGWGWYSHADNGYTGYVKHVAANYQVTAENIYWANLSWANYCEQIDTNHPVLILVDTDGDSGSDHFVAGIGYGTKDGTNYYACYDTYDPADEVCWYPFTGIGGGAIYGIYGVTFLDLNQDPPEKAITPYPTNNATDMPINVTISWENGGRASGYDVYLGTNSVPGSNEFLCSRQSTFYDLPTLQTQTVYYWRIDATNISGVATGDVWSFKTAELVVHYVNDSGSDSWPYTTWETASDDIWAAISASSHGDWIMVSNGLYQQGYQINVYKNIRILSVNGPDVTIIDGQESYRCLLMTKGIVEGFTIRNGNSSAGGGGVCFDNGGQIANCKIAGSSSYYGGAIQFKKAGEARNCVIVSNWADQGGGVYFEDGGTIQNCTITDNQAYFSEGGGVYCTNGGTIVNSIIQFNRASSGSNHYDGGSGWSYTNTCTTPLPAGPGNIVTNPHFRSGTGNLRLKSYSACVNTGTNIEWMTGAMDMDNHPRILESFVDMGAFERDPALVDVFTLTVASHRGAPEPAVGEHTYDIDAVLTNTVTSPDEQAGTQYVCTGWAMSGHGPASGTTNTMTMTITNNATLTWTWTTNVQFTRVAGPNGSVTGPADGWYALGGSVTVTAVSDVNHHFAGWSGDTSGDTNNVVMALPMNSGRAIVGNFAIDQHTVTFIEGDNGGISGTLIQSIDHGSDCSPVTAEPDDHYHFTGWSGDHSGMENPLTVSNVTGAMSITANFGINLHTLAISSEYGASSPAVGTYTNDYGSVLTNCVTGPEPVGGTQYVCSGWTMAGNEPGTGSATNMTMALTNDATLTWAWDTQLYFICNVGADGEVTGDASGWYLQGAGVNVTAVPDEHCHFTGWSGDLPPERTNDTALALTMDNRRSINAAFGPSESHDCDLSGGSMNATWDADSDCFYQLQACSDIVNPAWSNVSQVVTATANTVTLSDTNQHPGPLFYRPIQIFP